MRTAPWSLAVFLGLFIVGSLFVALQPRCPHTFVVYASGGITTQAKNVDKQ